MAVATLYPHRGRAAIRFEVDYPIEVATVWLAASDPAAMRTWFPSSVEYTPETGSEIHFGDDPNQEDSVGTVILFNEPHAFAFSWGGDEIYMTLDPNRRIQHKVCVD